MAQGLSTLSKLHRSGKVLKTRDLYPPIVLVFGVGGLFMMLCVKLKYDDEIKQIPCACAIERTPGSLYVYDSRGELVARFHDHVESWWLTDPRNENIIG